MYIYTDVYSVLALCQSIKDWFINYVIMESTGVDKGIGYYYYYYYYRVLRAIIVSQSTAASSASCKRSRPPSNLVNGQELTMCDIVCK